MNEVVENEHLVSFNILECTYIVVHISINPEKTTIKFDIAS